MFTLVTVLILFRYYSLQREEINSVAQIIRDAFVTDVKNVAGNIYAAGVATREAYEVNAPKVVTAYNVVATKVRERFGAAS